MIIKMNSMKNNKYFNAITERLDFFSVRVQHLGSMNLHDINIHAEYFFMHFLNQLYGWNLVNQNDFTANAPGVDLRYDGGQIVVQVTSTVTREKVQYSLNKLDATAFNGYTFKFLSIGKDADNLRNKIYTIPADIAFDPEKDILDIKAIYSSILGISIDKQKAIYELTLKYMSIDTPSEKRVKGLSRIIQILSGDKYLNTENQNYDKREFEIVDKIQKNKLDELQEKILDLSPYQLDVNKVYDAFDVEGVNKSRAVLHAINSVYLRLKNTRQGQELFEAIAEDIYIGMQDEPNLREYNEEDIRYYIDIILADAFVRCKIFENPKNIQ